MRGFLVGLMATLFLLAGAGSAGALMFELDNVEVSSHAFGDGLLIQTQSLVNQSKSFDLQLGGSETFSLFEIWTTEGHVHPGEDTVPRDIAVAFTFSEPAPGFGGTVIGETYGTSDWAWVYWLPIKVQYGIVEWPDEPQIFSFGLNGTGELEVALSGTAFNRGLYGLSQCDPGIVEATFTYKTAPVPEPATLLLLGMGVLGVGVIGRKKLLNP